VSIDPKNKPLSAMKVRRWASQLLSRSILLGASSDGVSMVSVVGVVLQFVGSGRNGIFVDFSATSSEITRLRLILRTNYSKGSVVFVNVSSILQQLAKKAQRLYQSVPTRLRCCISMFGVQRSFH
jgi:hypothetical protein